MTKKNHLKINITLFWEFFKISSVVLGGGYAILLVAEDIFVKKHHWLKPNELTNTLTLIQTVPGLTAGNVAIYTGYQCSGIGGALAALTGVATPSFIIITAIAMFFHNIPIDHPLVIGAFLGVRTCTTALVIVAFIRMWKSAITSKFQFFFFLTALMTTLLFHSNPGWIILAGILFGIFYFLFFFHKIAPYK